MTATQTQQSPAAKEIHGDAEAKHTLAEAGENLSRDNAERHTNRDNGLRRYVHLLQRDGQLTASELEEITCIVRDLEIGPSQMASDRTLVNRFLDFSDRHRQCGQANRDQIATRDQVRQFEKEAATQLRALERVHNVASARYSQCRQAHGELLRIQRSRPQLFEIESDPPRLLISD